MIHREGCGGAKRRSDFNVPTFLRILRGECLPSLMGRLRADEVSLPPDSDVIHPHLLREWRAGVRTADEIASHRNVEKYKELGLELRRAVDPPRYVSLVVLHPVQVPSHGRGGAGHGEYVEPVRQRNGRRDVPSIRGVRAVVVGPVHGAEILERVLASHFHDVYLTAGRPSYGADRIAQRPERRPNALTLWHSDPGFDPGVGAEALTPLRFEAGRGVGAPPEVLPASFDYQHSILNARVLSAIGVILQLVVAEAAVTQIVSPIRAVDRRPVEFVRPD